MLADAEEEAARAREEEIGECRGAAAASRTCAGQAGATAAEPGLSSSVAAPTGVGVAETQRKNSTRRQRTLAIPTTNMVMQQQ